MIIIKIMSKSNLRRFQFPFLTKRLKIRVIPTIVVIIDAKIVDYVRGFDDLGGNDEFRTETLEWRLSWYFYQLFTFLNPYIYFFIQDFLLSVFLSLYGGDKLCTFSGPKYWNITDLLTYEILA